MDVVHVQNETRQANTAQEEIAAYRTGNDLPGTSGYSNSCPPHPYEQPPPYFINGCSNHPPFIIGPNLPHRDIYYETGEFATQESIKLSEACGFYLGVLSIAFITASFLTFYYYVYLDV